MAFRKAIDVLNLKGESKYTWPLPLLTGSASSTGAKGEVGKGGAGFQLDTDPVPALPPTSCVVFGNCEPLFPWR